MREVTARILLLTADRRCGLRVGVPVSAFPINRNAIDRDSQSGISIDQIASGIQILMLSRDPIGISISEISID